MPGVWFSLVFYSFILPSMVHDVYPILPPSSLFVLITSRKAHTACPQRERQRDTQRAKRESRRVEREHPVFIGDSLCSTFAITAYLCTTISHQHLASEAWFILNNAAYANPAIIIHAYVCVSAFVPKCVRMPACVCIFQLCGRPTPVPLICQLSRVAMGTTKGPREVMKMLWIVARWPWKSQRSLIWWQDVWDAMVLILYMLINLFKKGVSTTLSHPSHNALKVYLWLSFAEFTYLNFFKMLLRQAKSSICWELFIHH